MSRYTVILFQPQSSPKVHMTCLWSLSPKLSKKLKHLLNQGPLFSTASYLGSRGVWNQVRPQSKPAINVPYTSVKYISPEHNYNQSTSLSDANTGSDTYCSAFHSMGMTKSAQDAPKWWGPELKTTKAPKKPLSQETCII